jgi:hypothetical protein
VVRWFFRDPRQPDHLAAAQNLATVAGKRASRETADGLIAKSAKTTKSAMGGK